MTLSTDIKFFGERAEWLATLLLTRDSRLQVTPANNEEADLLVAILQDGRPTSRRFEVVIKSEVTLLPSETVTEGPGDQRLMLQESSAVLARYRDSPIPVVLFYFQMRQNDMSWYRWLIEPVVGVDIPRAQLKVNTERKLEKLDQDSLNQIIQHVDDWYDSRSNL